MCVCAHVRACISLCVVCENRSTAVIEFVTYRITEFSELWKDLLQQPQTLSPQLTG